jgi:hypothetical protein
VQMKPLVRSKTIYRSFSANMGCPRPFYAIMAVLGEVAGRPAHPQTQGKEERFHRTLKTELLQGRSFSDLADCQRHFDPWRERYNLVRPHEALHLDPPVRHFQLSQRTFPEVLPAIEYNSGEIVRKVQSNGDVTFHDREYRVGKGLVGEYVALRPTSTDGVFEVYFSHYKVRQITVTKW